MARPAEFEKHLRTLRTLPARAGSATAGLTDAQLDTPYREGGWTARQVVHHLADAHLNAAVRVRLALTEDHPTVKPYDQDRWAALEDARTLPLGPSLDILRGVHERLVALFESLPDDAWNRTVHHPEAGTIRVSDFLSIYSAHGDHHLDQILDLRRRSEW